MELTSLEGALEVPGKLALFILLRLAFRLESATGDPQWFTGLSPASLWAVTSTYRTSFAVVNDHKLLRPKNNKKPSAILTLFSCF